MEISTEHGYPRTYRYSYICYANGTNIAIASTTTEHNDSSPMWVFQSAGGLVAPLQMEFIASILENSTA